MRENQDSIFARELATREPANPAKTRIESIDLLRGIIIVVMALDHSRDFFGDIAAAPTDLTTTTVALFFTRWVTHICAPVFFLLTGSSAYLTLRRISKPELSRFLLIRGAWLIFLDAVVMRFALQFNLDYHTTILTVLWGLGWAMIALAALVWLPLWAVATFGAVLVLGHNALDAVEPSALGSLAPVWSILHAPGIIFHNSRSVVLVSYVLIPWIGVTALGYVLAGIYTWSPPRRRNVLLWLGVGLVLGFCLLRFSNLYGDPTPWSMQKNSIFTLMSFINTNKYPPSLLFLLMTLGPAMLLLRAFDEGVPKTLRPALVIGKVPLFFYILHFFLIHALAVAWSALRYHRINEMFQSPDLAHFPFSPPAGWNVGLPTVYLGWFLVVLVMYPLCRWYARIKQRKAYWWLSYL